MLSEKFLLAMSDINSDEIDAVAEILGYKKSVSLRKTRSMRRVLFIAAIMAVFLAFGVSAYAAVSRVIMKKEVLDINPQPGTDQVTYSFESAADVFIDCMHWLPSGIPGDYSLDFVSEYFTYNGSQNMRYKNSSGARIEFMYGKPGPGMSITVDNAISEEETVIGSNTALLSKTPSGNILVWSNDVAGYAFVLTCTDTELDIVDIAESIVGLDEPVTATNAGYTAEAIEILGEYKPAFLPDGYAENGFYGNPNGFAYVRRYYVNKTTNRSIHFSYELYSLDDETMVEELIGLNLGRKSLEINGLPAAMDINEQGATLYWADENKSMLFVLYTDGVQPDELLEVARSVE